MTFQSLQGENVIGHLTRRHDSLLLLLLVTARTVVSLPICCREMNVYMFS